MKTENELQIPINNNASITSGNYNTGLPSSQN